MYNELINLNCKSILNCGCGTGNDFITFRDLFEKNNIKVMGIEYSDFMIEEAKKNSLPVLKGNIKNISFDDNSFDSSIAIDVFEHLNELSIALNEMIRISKKKVIISFFKTPIEENTTINVNIHNYFPVGRDVKMNKTLKKNQLYIKENPGWRNGFTKGCFYNYHNKNLIEKELLNNDKVENYNWYFRNYDDINKNCYLLINLKI